MGRPENVWRKIPASVEALRQFWMLTCSSVAHRAPVPSRALLLVPLTFDGHWLHRWLEGRGVVSHEVDPSNIKVNRRARRAKTDRLDLARIMRGPTAER